MRNIMTAGKICVREVDLAKPDETVQVAAQRMHSHNVGSLLVLNEFSVPVGLVTDRDLAVRVVAHGLDPADATVEQVMTRSPETIHEETSIEDALSRMRNGPYRRLPVVDSDDKLVGILSLDDVLNWLVHEFNEIGQLLKKESPSSLADI